MDGAIYEGGYLRGSGQEVWFVGDEAVQSKLNGCGPCQILPPYGYTWNLDGDTLTFSDPKPRMVDPCLDRPWKRIDG